MKSRKKIWLDLLITPFLLLLIGVIASVALVILLVDSIFQFVKEKIELFAEIGWN